MRLSLVVIVTAMMGVATTTLLPVSKGLGVSKTTAHRIAGYNYPVETHQVQTSDGYILTMFRIPYSPNLQNENTHRPVVFLQHGVISSSDCWILNGPDNALAYLLADAGYDVWMGNNRGNTYSKKNIFMSHLLSSFWNFSWNEIAIKDLPAMIDYVLHETKEKALHYVGHSQGTTVFFVLMSVIPSYNTKIKTAHMLAPVAYTKHMGSPIAKVAALLLGNPSFLSELIGNYEFLPSNKLLSMMRPKTCTSSPIFHQMCANVLFLIGGWDSKHLNYTLLPDILETHPAGVSTTQIIHYLQGYVSGFFRKFDYGERGNMLKYNQWSPPRYIESNIVAPVRFYYSANDYLAAVMDVQKMMRLLPNLVYSFYVPIPDFNHLDFLWAMQVKPLLYDKIIKAANHYEQTGQQ